MRLRQIFMTTIFIFLGNLLVLGQETTVQLSTPDANHAVVNPDSSTQHADSVSFAHEDWPGYQLHQSSDIKDFSLEECIQLALENNRILKVYRLSEKSARINLKLAESRFLPSGFLRGGRNASRNDDLGYLIVKETISSSIGLSRALETGGSVSVGVNNSISESSNNTGVTNYNTGVGISFTQPLLKGAGFEVNKIPIRRAKTYATISLLNIKQNLINLITNIESRYWDLILVYEDYKIQQEALQRTKDLLDVNKSLIEAGRMASQEIVQAESDVASREISVANAENAIINTQVALLGQLDLTNRITIHPTTKMTFEETDVILEDCLRKAFKYRPDWKINQKYLEIEEMNLIVAKNNNRYQLGSYGGISSNSTSISSIGMTFKEAFQFESLTWNIGLSFTFPFNREVLRNGVILQQLSRDRRALYVAELEDNIRIAVENAVRNVRYSLNQVKLAQRAKALSEKKLLLEEEKMKVGRSTNFQVISYQRDLTNAQNQELRNIATYLKALGRLDRIMGTTLLKWRIELE